MELLDLVAVLVSLAAVFGYVNSRWLGLPSAIGLMLVALAFSISIAGLGELGLDLDETIRGVLAKVDFSKTLMLGMLSSLLFAGSLHVDLTDLRAQASVIATLATFGIMISVACVAVASHLVFGWLGLEIPWIACLLFGALISPTDPIAVLGILKTAGVPPGLRTKIAGESLFNDGVGVVVFVALLGFLPDGSGHASDPTVASIAMLFAQEAIGGVLLGLALGLVGYGLLKSIDDHQVEILISLAIVLGGYSLAIHLHTSGPLAIVVAGLLIGNYGRLFAMSETTREHLDTFWELIDDMLNAVLFVLIGLEVLVVTFDRTDIAASILLIPVVILARFVAVGVPIVVMRLGRDFSPGVIRVLTWGGLRGGISIALALSLPASEWRSTLVAATYAVVVFSIVVQGLTIAPLARRLRDQGASA